MTNERNTAYNSTYPKGGVSCSKDSLVVNQTLVFQIKFYGKSPALRVAAKRYARSGFLFSNILRIRMKKLIQNFPLLSFVVLNYVISWTFLYPCYRILLAAPDDTFPPLSLIGLIGAYGPSFAALMIVAILHGKEGVRVLLKSFSKWKEHPGWYLYAILFPAVLYLIAALAHGHSLPDIKQGLQNIPLALLIAIPFGPLGEELGWRGYFLPELLKKHSTVVSTIILGFVWTVWHLASFTYPGAAIPSFLGVGPWSVSLYLCEIMAESFVFTYVYLKTRGSLIIAILLHAGFNASANIAQGFFPSLSDPSAGREGVFVTYIILTGVTALGLALLSFRRTE